MGNPNNAATGAIVATFIAGEAIGAITQSLFGDQLGRKCFMQIMCILVRLTYSNSYYHVSKPYMLV
jgi:MFS family permease